MKKRIFYYDQLRVFAIICIIACHVSADIVVKTDIFGTNLFLYSLMLNSLREIGVPLFIMISGALLLNKKESFSEFFKKRLSRVLVPYIFWLMTFYLFLSILANFNIYSFNLSPFEYIYAALIGLTGVWHYLWFVPMILAVYIVIFLLNKLNEKNENTLLIALILSIALIVFTDFNLMSFPNLIIYYMFYSVYAVIGYHIANLDVSNNGFLRKINVNNNNLCIISFLLMIMIFTYQLLLDFNLSILNGKFYHVSYFTISNMFLLISTFLFFMCLSKSSGKLNGIYDFLENSWIGKFTLSFSLCSYGIYLSHMIILLSVNYFIRYLKPEFPFAYLTILLISTILCSWALILVLGKIPFVNRLCGKN